jgi:hypothetical protein
MNNKDSQAIKTHDEKGKELPSSKIWREDMLPHNLEKSTPIMKFSECCKSEVVEVSTTEGLHFKCFRCKKFCDIAEPVNEKLTTANQEVQEVNESMEYRLKDKFPFFFCIHQGMILDFVNSELALERKKILDILVDEINIAHTHNQQTSRITSAYNRINELK